MQHLVLCRGKAGPCQAKRGDHRLPAPLLLQQHCPPKFPLFNRGPCKPRPSRLPLPGVPCGFCAGLGWLCPWRVLVGDTLPPQNKGDTLTQQGPGCCDTQGGPGFGDTMPRLASRWQWPPLSPGLPRRAGVPAGQHPGVQALPGPSWPRWDREDATGWARGHGPYGQRDAVPTGEGLRPLSLRDHGPHERGAVVPTAKGTWPP